MSRVTKPSVLSRITMLAAALALVLAIGACGSSKKSAGTKSTGGTAQQNVTAGKRGGTLTVLSSGDVDYVDPGQDYYQFGYMLNYAVNRGLYAFEPSDTVKPHPDLATADPEISADQKTITIRIRPDIQYAPPVNRVVISKDIKYAIERGFSANVPNAYAASYFGTIVGAPKKPQPTVPDIPGIETPDRYTIVFKLSTPSAGTVAGALVLPLSMPVPEEYAKPFDAKSPSTYDEHVAFVGPYMVEHDAKGKLTGRRPGKSITVVRNPNWNDKADFRPAYLDKIVFQEGNTDTAVATRRVLNGSHVVTGDFTLPPDLLKKALAKTPRQVNITQTAAFRAIALNTTVKPFDDLNVRKAINAVFDRQALILSRGGTTQGTPAWSYLPPDFPGYAESGGANPPAEFDYMQNISGNLDLAKSYMKKAGYPSGLYTGSEHPLLVGVAGGSGTKAAEISQAQLLKLGIKVKFRLTTPDAYLTKFCGQPKAKVGVCPSFAWGKDFADAQTMLQPTFDGRAILPNNNTNPSVLNDPAVNAAIDKAVAQPPGPGRNKAWAEVNKLIVGTAAAIPYQWDKTVNASSKDVNAVLNTANTSYDLNYTSLK